jgi:hypothetical protein
MNFEQAYKASERLLSLPGLVFFSQEHRERIRGLLIKKIIAL